MANSKMARFGSLFLAIVFLITSVGFTIFILWQSRQDSADDAIDLTQQTETNEETTMLEGQPLDNFTPITTPVTELQIIDTEVGTGEEVKPGANVTAHYTGAIASTGIIFQSSHDFGQPVPFSLSGVIKGWTDGVPGMKVGGKRRLIIPYALAYGEEGNPPTIPGKADLVFDIELVAVEQ